jgi:hypothetical protein
MPMKNFPRSSPNKANMNIKTIILVTIALIVGAFFALETALTFANRGLVFPVLTKAGIAAAALYYAISTIKKRKVQRP